MSSSLLPVISTLTVFPSTNTQSISQRAFKTRTNRTQGFRVSCNNAPDDHNDKKLILPEAQKLVLPNVDRRNLIVGLGGLYTATNLTSLPALADPVVTPDIRVTCKEAKDGIKYLDDAIRSRKCCPPVLSGKPIEDYVIPSNKKVRERWPAHKGTQKQMDNYRDAIKIMKTLKDDDPRSFENQAKIHCAYCNGAYTQQGSDTTLQIHNSWLFFPFHRWYVYFYERILGSLIGVDDFALPFWKWDEPAGMPIPEIFLPKDYNGELNPLYDKNRDEGSVKDRIVDLAFQGTDRDRSEGKQVACNLNTVYRDLVRNGADTLSFFGGKYVAGKTDGAKPSGGSVEAGSHTAVHRWVGDDKKRNDEDMGNFYSAGYDPLFYVHHANVDRTWKLWKDLALPGHVDPTDPDWLNASYVFYDEHKNLVRVYNRDCVDINKLGYSFTENSKEVFPWRKSRPVQRSPSAQIQPKEGDEPPTVKETNFPLSLEKIVKLRVERPAVNRTAEDKKKKSEVLLINEIKFDCNNFVKFDVFVNDKVSATGIIPTVCDPEYAGCFAQIPHSDVKKTSMKSGARFGLNQLMDDTKSESDKYATVALVPKAGFEGLTIGEIKIELVDRLSVS